MVGPPARLPLPASCTATLQPPHPLRAPEGCPPGQSDGLPAPGFRRGCQQMRQSWSSGGLPSVSSEALGSWSGARSTPTPPASGPSTLREPQTCPHCERKLPLNHASLAGRLPPAETLTAGCLPGLRRAAWAGASPLLHTHSVGALGPRQTERPKQAAFNRPCLASENLSLPTCSLSAPRLLPGLESGSSVAV